LFVAFFYQKNWKIRASSKAIQLCRRWRRMPKRVVFLICFPPWSLPLQRRLHCTTQCRVTYRSPPLTSPLHNEP